MQKTLSLLTLLLCGCASSYKPITPSANYFQHGDNYSGLEFSYKMGILSERRNRKYAKREDKKGIRVVAVRLANNTGRPLVAGQDFRFFSRESELILLDPQFVHQELKQGVPIYLLYLLLSPMQLYTGDEQGNIESTPIGLILGPGIAFGNMVGAGAANQHFLRDLERFSIIGKTIEAGETVYGLISIRDNAYNPIRIVLGDSNDNDVAK